MRRGGARTAIVVDEFGTVVGLATFEDVVEEVVGEAFERGERQPVAVEAPGSAMVNGWTTVSYVNEQLGLAVPTEGPFETVGGLVTHHVGRVAEEGDQVALDGVVFTVAAATPRRVRRVRVEWEPDAEEPP